MLPRVKTISSCSRTSSLELLSMGPHNLSRPHLGTRHLHLRKLPPQFVDREWKRLLPLHQEKYYTAAACQHLAAMCRMYNDRGSAVRDRDEANVNSINFRDLELDENISPNEAIPIKQDTLFEIAQYEYAWIEEAFRRLESHREQKASAEVRARKRRRWTSGVCSTTLRISGGRCMFSETWEVA